LDQRPDVGLFYDAFGVPAVVTRPYPDITPITTTVIWVTPETDGRPLDLDLQVNELRNVMSFRSDDVATVPIGTVAVAARLLGQDAKRWRVDSIVRVMPDEKWALVSEVEP
jgi:hypothetical protein